MSRHDSSFDESATPLWQGRYSENSAMIEEGCTFKVMNSIGKLIFESKVLSREMFIPKELFADGIYFVAISNALETKTVQFVYCRQ